MTLANKLTVLRLLFVPVLLVFLFMDCAWCDIGALVVFLLGSFTDFLDGYVARKTKSITNFGKLADPLADKILVLSALCVLIKTAEASIVCIVIILMREFAVSGLRVLCAAGNSKVVPAGIWGKAKTVTQMIAVSLLIINTRLPQLEPISIGNIMLIISGIGFTNALRDLFVGDSIAGVLRLLEAVLTAIAIAAGYFVFVFLRGAVL